MVLSASKIGQIAQAADPKKAILAAIGDLSGVEVYSDLVLVGIFIRPEKTAGGIIRPPENIQEDEYQGKVGLVLKSGPIAYGDWEDPGERGYMAEIGSWVVFAIKDGWAVQFNGVPCRFVPYDKLRARLEDPMMETSGLT
jgi:hypothetical protein